MKEAVTEEKIFRQTDTMLNRYAEMLCPDSAESAKMKKAKFEAETRAPSPQEIVVDDQMSNFKSEKHVLDKDNYLISGESSQQQRAPASAISTFSTSSRSAEKSEIDVDAFLEEALRLSNKMVDQGSGGVGNPSQHFITEIDDTGYTGLTFSTSELKLVGLEGGSPQTPMDHIYNDVNLSDTAGTNFGLAASSASCPPVPDEREICFHMPDNDLVKTES